MWRCCSFLFFLTHRFSSKHKMKSSTELFTSWSDYINHVYFDSNRRAIHTLPHQRGQYPGRSSPTVSSSSSTSSSFNQSPLSSMSTSTMSSVLLPGRHFIEVPSNWTGIWMFLSSAPQFPLFLWKTFTVICYSDPFYGPYYLLHHVWSQVTSFCHY